MTIPGTTHIRSLGATVLTAAAALTMAPAVEAAPVVSRLTPPSALFSFGDTEPPIIARFLPGQRFDLQATIKADASQTITSAQFKVDGSTVPGMVSFAVADVSGAFGSTIVTRRAYSQLSPGVHQFSVVAQQSNGESVTATGNFEIVGLDHENKGGKRARNIIICIGDGMGIAHRTAARLMLHGAQLGKANAMLAMDTFPNTALLITHSLNSIVTDSAPGAHCYSTGNKGNNNQQGVFPDDTRANFDNPRIELIGEYLFRTQGKTLGIVTTSDVFDATPGAFGSHTQARSAGQGICDQYLDEGVPNGLRVLMGGGRKWFLPSGQPGSARSINNDYVLPGELAEAWGVPVGAVDPTRDLLANFVSAGFTYAPDRAALSLVPASTFRLLGLFSFSNMNVAKDKLDKRRGASPAVVDDYGFPDQPMLEEMTETALEVLRRNEKGFVLMVEAASIDKQAHNMDTERWIMDTIEFDKAVAVCKEFAEEDGNTLVIVTADHECAGVNIIGASLVTNEQLKSRAASGGGAASLRAGVVGTYENAGFPFYPRAADGYPATTDPDRRMLVGYAANADRYEDWLTNPQPLRDSQQPFNGVPPLSVYPTLPINRDVAGGFQVTGQVADTTAVHTASDIPLSAFGLGASLFNGVMDNTDVFFKLVQASMGGEKMK